MSDAGDGYVAQSSDTDVAADRIQFQIYAKMSVAEKVEAFENLCRDARELSLIGDFENDIPKPPRRNYASEKPRSVSGKS